MGALDKWFQVAGKQLKVGIKATAITAALLIGFVVSGFIAITDAINGHTNWAAIIIAAATIITFTYLAFFRWK